MPNNIGEAYIQIKPSMEGVSGEIEKAMGGAGAAGSSSFGSAFGSGLKKTGAVIAGATAAVASATAAVTGSIYALRRSICKPDMLALQARKEKYIWISIFIHP